MALVHLLQSEKEELEKAKLKAEAEVVLIKTKPSYPDINQLTKLLVTSLKPELSKLLASHDFASCLPTELKELPSKITRLSREIKELKQYIKDMETELSGDLIEIPTKLELFTSTISSLSSQVTHTLNRFSTMMDNASGATSMNVPSTGQATASPTEGEKNTKDAGTNLKDELIDLLGKDVVKHLSALVAEVPSASALQVLRRLGSILLVYMQRLHKLDEGFWLDLQFSMADNSKLNMSILLKKLKKYVFTSKRFTRREKDCIMSKGIKQPP
ncbi:hypothetical protein Tco_0940959 [Tanacetum coccineum]|uniref:Uncharacterized protein n=1 Tax=Tanacetum coccineum TaxID=301880 RepID=A0ABQ5DW52_9ASTR